MRPIVGCLMAVLLVAGLATLLGCARVRPWQQVLTGEKLAAWEDQLKARVVFPADQTPTDPGMWVDNGLGWQGPFRGDLPVPFCSPQFRVCSVNQSWISSLPTTAGTTRLCGSKGGSVGQLTTEALGADVWRYTIRVTRRSADGLYCFLGKTVKPAPVFAYVDPAKAFQAVEQSTTDQLDGALRILDEQGQELASYPNTFYQLGLMELGAVTIRSPESLPIKFSVEISADGSTPLFYHWSQMVWASPHITQECEWWDATIQERRPKQLWPAGSAVVNVDKSSSVRVWIDVTLALVSNDADADIRVDLGPRLVFVIPASGYTVTVK